MIEQGHYTFMEAIGCVVSIVGFAGLVITGLSFLNYKRNGK